MLIKIIGADIGNDTLKIVDEGGNQFEIMNVVSPGYDRRIMNEKSHLSNLLDVDIHIDDSDLGRFFVGGLAYTNNRGDLIEKTANDIKATNIDTLILLATGLAYSNYDPNCPVKDVNIALGAGLPVEEYFDDKLLDTFKKNINKKIKVKFNSKEFNDAVITVNVVETDVKPEGTASALDFIYDESGIPKAGNENYENEVHMYVDIGGITTDISIMEYGEFNPKGFIGISIGTSEAIDKIAYDLKINEGVNISRHKLDYIIRKDQPLKIQRDGQLIDITKKLNMYKEIRFNNFIKLLVNRVYKELSLNGIDPSYITHVDMTGGGSITYIDKFKSNFKGNVRLIPDARFANARGYLLAIKLKMKECSAASDEVFEETIVNG